MEKLNNSPMAELISKVEKYANEGDPKAEDLMREIGEFRVRAEKIIDERGAEEKKLKLKNEVEQEKEISQWVSGIARGVGVEAKILTPFDLALIARHHVGVFETDVVELNKIRIGPDGPAIAKGWCEDFQKLIFPDGKEGLLQVRFDDEGVVADVRIKRR
ncbi:hypothetical protein HZA44_01090 [Candidatus Peregrinibacteria bacterium]|nr:hypothetical protein [Candidatus Peregrinibacteria bacterium]